LIVTGHGSALILQEHGNLLNGKPNVLVLSKPFNNDELKAAVGRVLSSRAELRLTTGAGATVLVRQAGALIGHVLLEATALMRGMLRSELHAFAAETSVIPVSTGVPAIDLLLSQSRLNRFEKLQTLPVRVTGKMTKDQAARLIRVLAPVLKLAEALRIQIELLVDDESKQNVSLAAKPISAKILKVQSPNQVNTVTPRNSKVHVLAVAATKASELLGGLGRLAPGNRWNLEAAVVNQELDPVQFAGYLLEVIEVAAAGNGQQQRNEIRTPSGRFVEALKTFFRTLKAVSTAA
jgi:hypothetical protein